jgi:hypothetical protein
MPSSGYAIWSVIAGEQPTTAKWNILGANDASFNTGQGFNDGSILARHYAANSVKSGSLALSNALDSVTGVLSYTNSGGSGGTGYYINLGGLKMCWGITGALSVGGSGNQVAAFTINWPSGFFSTIQSVTVTPNGTGVGATQFLYTNGKSVPGTVSQDFWLVQTNGASGTAAAAWFVIGT